MVDQEQLLNDLIEASVAVAIAPFDPALIVLAQEVELAQAILGMSATPSSPAAAAR